MNSITIYKDNVCESTVIPNKFIDEYMVMANDAQIKVYLYLLRMMNANLPTGISDMADKFNHTEKDILRALKYWEKCRVLDLEYDEAKNLTGIRFLSDSESKSMDNRPLAPIVPLKLVTSNSADKENESVKQPDVIVENAIPNAMPTYSREQLKQFKDSPVLMLAETYFKKTLSKTDIETLYFINYDLNFTEDLIDYLLQYCTERDKKSISYVRKVAINWAEAGILTPKQAKSYINGAYDKNVYVIMKALGRNTNPTDKEAEIISKWYKELGFDIDVISEACGRTVLATDSHRLEYCDKILLSWKSAGIHSLQDVKALDSNYKKARPTQAQPRNNFNKFSQTSNYDFDELEKSILSN